MMLEEQLSKELLDRLQKDSICSKKIVAEDIYKNFSKTIALNYLDCEINDPIEFVSKKEYLALIDFVVQELKNISNSIEDPIICSHIENKISYLTQKSLFIESMDSSKIVAFQKFDDLVTEIKDLLLSL